MANVDLKTLSYDEHKGDPHEWRLEGLALGQVNLLVGRNATGKTRTMNIISSLASQLLQEKVAVGTGHYTVEFSADGCQLEYNLNVKDSQVSEERLMVDGIERLIRNGDSLSLWYEQKGEFIDHQPTTNEISAAARKDKKQHPYLILLDSWARSVRHYRFGTPLGQGNLAMFVEKSNMAPELDDRNQENVVAVFAKGKKDCPGYVESVLSDMHDLGYQISDIDVGIAENVTVTVKPAGLGLPGRLSAIRVLENGIGGHYSQIEMSQGMFRALSVLAQVTYSQMSQRAHCILIDDIGEGLDFERSAKLIEILRAKALDSKFQLIMSTNDQYVMNHVPLQEWSVLQRRGPHVTVKNIQNSKKAFEDFKFVGMSNFAFFEMDFASSEEGDDRQLLLEGMQKDA